MLLGVLVIGQDRREGVLRVGHVCEVDSASCLCRRVLVLVLDVLQRLGDVLGLNGRIVRIDLAQRLDVAQVSLGQLVALLSIREVRVAELLQALSSSDPSFLVFGV